ncbi:MAG: N-acetylglucosamine-6-phosphate deacetylase [Clostridia bacterium]|nr:N-acetylglucosamine-6-phosphate deacetylase [Clostridia bacterium]
MRRIIKSNLIVLPSGIFDGFIVIEDGKIAEITEKAPEGEMIDATGNYVMAGFVDIHTHGGGGFSFTEASPDEIVDGCVFHMTHGTTTIVPTVTTGAFPIMREAVKNIQIAKKNPLVRNLLGAHMEGPYLSPAQCGAQAPGHITEPKPEEYISLVEETGNTIVRWTYAPERDKDGEFCRFLKEHGILASAGHTDAKYSDMALAIENGLSLVTHLYSCTSTVTRDHGFRSLGVIESTFLRDELCAEIIADGKHLPPDLVRMIVKIKGIDNVAAVTDSLCVAGSPATSGVMSGVEYIVEDGVAKLSDRSAFAGSVATADVLLRTLVNECGFTLSEASTMLSATPARLFGLNTGKLEVGLDSDIVVLNKDFEVQQVFVRSTHTYKNQD